MCGDPEDPWEELESVLVMSSTVVDLHDMSINRCSGAIGEMRPIGSGDGLQHGRALLRAGYPLRTGDRPTTESDSPGALPAVGLLCVGVQKTDPCSHGCAGRCGTHSRSCRACSDCT